MNIVLLRVGIDTGSGGMHGPLLNPEGDYEYIPIPDDRYDIDKRTYGNTKGILTKKPLIEFFSKGRRPKKKDQAMHYDPEFETFTYGDPTKPKGSLRRLEKSDLLIFYCGLNGFGDYQTETADLYLFAYFKIIYKWLTIPDS